MPEWTLAASLVYSNGTRTLVHRSVANLLGKKSAKGNYQDSFALPPVYLWLTLEDIWDGLIHLNCLFRWRDHQPTRSRASCDILNQSASWLNLKAGWLIDGSKVLILSVHDFLSRRRCRVMSIEGNHGCFSAMDTWRMQSPNCWCDDVSTSVLEIHLPWHVVAQNVNY